VSTTRPDSGPQPESDTAGTPAPTPVESPVSAGDRPTPATEFETASRTQLSEIRERLLTDAAHAGLDPDHVTATIDHATELYRGARVRSFVGILVERHVRNALDLVPQPK
jgi:hypothetical protein